MERLCFTFELNAGCEEEYDTAHQAVWPELLDVLDQAGVYDYSIFRDGTMLFAFLKVRDDWDTSGAVIGASEVQARWEVQMAPLIAWQRGPEGGLRFAREVFRHAGVAGPAGTT